MRKVIGVLLMILVIGIFSACTLNQVSDGEGESFFSKYFSKQKSGDSLEDIAQQLNTDYPNQAKEVITCYNKLLELYYKSKVKETELETYVTATSKLYSRALNELNTPEKQIEALKTEEKITLVASQIQDVYIVENDEKEEIGAEIVVLYATDSGSFLRNYKLIKESDDWKINSWKDYPINDSNEEQKEG